MVVHLNAISPFAIVIICVVALLIFGPKKLPELGRAVGATFREFKNGTKGLMDDEDDTQKKTTVIEQKDIDKENK